MSGMVDSSGIHANPVYPIDVLYGLNPVNGYAKVMHIVVLQRLLTNTCNMVWHCHMVTFHC